MCDGGCSVVGVVILMRCIDSVGYACKEKVHVLIKQVMYFSLLLVFLGLEFGSVATNTNNVIDVSSRCGLGSVTSAMHCLSHWLVISYSESVM